MKVLVLLLLALLPNRHGQEPEPIPQTPHDRVFELEITEDDPPLVDGRGSTVVAEYEVESAGTLHLWTQSDLDLFLRVEDLGSGALLGEDDDSGGAKTPFLRLPVEAGDYLAVLVAASAEGEVGSCELHVSASIETEATLAGAATLEAGALDVQGLRDAGDLDFARETARILLEETRGVAGALQDLQVVALLARLATLAEDLGDLECAREARSLVHSSFDATLPPTHSDLLAVRLNLANTVVQTGDIQGARTLFESVVVGFERTLPEDHPHLLLARGNLANTMRAMGDLLDARLLHESVVAVQEPILPADHPDLLRSRLNLAVTVLEMGDLPGARSLFESALSASEGKLPADHPLLLAARVNLASALFEMGEYPESRALFEVVLRTCERSLPADHPTLFAVRGNLANVIRAMGNLSEARELIEEALANHEHVLPADHREMLLLRGNLAFTLWKLGELPRARSLFEEVLAGYERTVSRDHPFLSRARLHLAKITFEMGDPGGARAILPALISGMTAHLRTALTLAPRQARESVAYGTYWLSGVLALSRGGDPELQREAFELQETMRMVAAEAARALRASEEPGIQALVLAADEVRAKLNNLASGEGREGGADPSLEIARVMEERDRLEREASKLLAEHAVAMQPVETDSLVTSIEEDSALVTFLRASRWPEGGEHLLAHVLAADGELARVDLGSARELEALVATWRAALGAPLGRGVAPGNAEAGRRPANEGDQGQGEMRGIALVGQGRGSEGESLAGEELRARLLDPILEELGERVRFLSVCADDLVFLVPLDALPLGGGRVGDRWGVRNEVSCSRLLEPSVRAAQAGNELLALGGVDYGGGGEVLAMEATVGASRGAFPDRFTSLSQTQLEADAIGALASDLLGVEPVVLAGEATTKAQLYEHAPGKRYLHLATHGWFAPEAIQSTLDADAGRRDWARMGLQERVTGMAPMLLCGLALAGANDPPDSLGRRSGILTAEELCSLDLSHCELAVLSACESNVGIRRAGQGIQSLQAALYAAGARSSITSLWKVDDAATRRLMELFYTKLWKDEMPKAEALWEAKRILREEGAPVRDWAGWVLTGDPD